MSRTFMDSCTTHTHTHTMGSINLMKISVPDSMQITPSTIYYLHHRKFLPLSK